MERKISEAQKLNQKLKWINFYRIFGVVFLVIAVISSTIAIVVSLNFQKYQRSMTSDRWISLVIKTQRVSETDEEIETPIPYQLQFQDYGSTDGLVDGSWKGQTLDAFLKSYPQVFTHDSSGMIIGILGSEQDESLKDYWWALYSATDPATINHPGQLAPGAPFMYLQAVNVYYFALHKLI